jgi:hypothetical protein
MSVNAITGLGTNPWIYRTQDLESGRAREHLKLRFAPPYCTLRRGNYLIAYIACF